MGVRLEVTFRCGCMGGIFHFLLMCWATISVCLSVCVCLKTSNSCCSAPCQQADCDSVFVWDCMWPPSAERDRERDQRRRRFSSASGSEVMRNKDGEREREGEVKQIEFMMKVEYADVNARHVGVGVSEANKRSRTYSQSSWVHF